MWRTAALLLSIALPAAAGAACPAPVAPSALAAQLDAAALSFGALDTDGFTIASDQARLSLGCVDALVPPRLAADYHRIEALRRFSAGDDESAASALAAAAALEPAYDFPDAMLPPGHALRARYVELAASPAAFERLPAPADGALAFDGARGRSRPAGRATIYQRLDDGGGVTGTSYLLPGGALPAYPKVPATRNRLLAGSGTLAAAALGSLALGATARSRFDDRSHPRTLDELQGLRDQTVIWAVTAGVFAAGSASLGVAGALTEAP